MTFAKPSSRLRHWREPRGLPHLTNIHRERRPAGLLLRGILKVKGKKKEVRGKVKVHMERMLGMYVPDFVAPPCCPPST